MIAVGCIRVQGQLLNLNLTNEIRNATVVLPDTTVKVGELLDKCYEITLYAEKLKADRDSLLLIVAQKDSIIALADSLYNKQIQMSVNERKEAALAKENYESLEKDYRAVRKGKIVRPSMGIGMSGRYSMTNALINGGGVWVSPGIFVKDRVLLNLNIGADILRPTALFDFGVNFGGAVTFVF